VTNEIFKIQIPIAGNAKPMALVYNGDRSVEVYIPITEDFIKMMGDKKKSFFYGFVDEDKTFHVEKEAPWQDW